MKKHHHPNVPFMNHEIKEKPDKKQKDVEKPDKKQKEMNEKTRQDKMQDIVQKNAVAGAVKRTLHHEGKRMKVKNLDFNSSSLSLIDIRDRKQYSASHIRNAFNIPADEWAGRKATELADFLREIYFDYVIAYGAASAEARSNIMEKGNTFDKVKETIKIKRDEHVIVLYDHDMREESLRRLESMFKLFTKVVHNHMDELMKEVTLLEGDKIPKFDVFILHKGFADLNQKKYGEFIYSKKENRTKSENWKVSRADFKISTSPTNSGMHTIIPGLIYFGELDTYLEFVEIQQAKSQQQIFDEARANESSSSSWHVVREIFDFREKVKVPEFLTLSADCTQSYGKRVETVVSKREKVDVKKSKGIFTTKKHQTTTVITEQTYHFTEDDNITRSRYAFENSFSFTWNTATIDVADLDDILVSIVYCIEGCLVTQKPILIQPCDYAVPVILYYLVHIRKWGIRRAFKFLFKRLPSELMLQSEVMIEPIWLLLRFEREILPHIWPSVPLRAVVLHQLNMEPDLDVNLKNFKKRQISEEERELFKQIYEGNAQYVLEKISQCPQLVLARNSLKERDETPLIATLHSDNPAVRLNQACLEALMTIESIRLSTIDGRDPLYYAIEAGNNFVKEIVNHGALVTTSSMKLKMNPLQRAIKYQLSGSTLQLLTTELTVNHKDLYRRTPCHYLVESSYSDNKMIKITEMFASKGANLHVQDIDGNTPLQYAQQKRPKIVKQLSKIASAEGNIRYHPFDGYAPVREDVNVHYYIDGEDTYKAMAEALWEAKRVVYITGWWLTPETFMVRSGDSYSDWKENQLINILGTIAERGVQVRVLLWENFDKAEDIKNALAAKKLEARHSNIKVILHTSSLIQGFTHHQKIIVVDEYDAFVGGLDVCLHRWDQQKHSIYPNFLYYGKDYFNARFLGDASHADNDVSNPKRDYRGLQDRNIPRSGWHDVHLRVDGLAAVDVSRNFVQRWNWSRKNYDSNKYEVLTPPSEDGVFSKPILATDADDHHLFRCSSVQITRSISKWSVGYQLKENSIINALKHAITTAKTHVYIETQFFISVQGDSAIINQKSGDVESLSDVILNRIRKAVRLDEPFKLIMVLPMYPEGNPTDYVTQRIMYWQLKTIEYIENEINTNICAGLPFSASDYIKFYSLANYAFIDNKIVAEQIYIHAKLLLTDDMIIVGSANLNMRSLSGDRDSEIAVVAHSSAMSNHMRCNLWKEHLGESVTLTNSVLDDFDTWDRIASSNTRYYKKLLEKSTPLGGPKAKEVFLDQEKYFSTIWKTIDAKKSFEIFVTKISGHLVKFPRKFLVDDIKGTEVIRAHPYNFFAPGIIGQIKEAAVVSIREDIVQ